MDNIIYFEEFLKHRKQKEAEDKRDSKFCEYKNCNEDLNPLNKFRCPYCRKYHCEEHKLPEEHGCRNPKLPYQMRLGFGVKSSSDNPSKTERVGAEN